MLRLKKKVVKQKEPILGSALACALALAALAFYLAVRRPTNSSAGANQTTSSEETRTGVASADDPVREVVSRPAARSPLESRRAFSAAKSFSQDKPFYEYSGIKTIDPSSPSTTPTPQPSPEPEKEASAPLPVVFQPIDPRLLKPTPEQQEVIDQLKQSFVDLVGSARLDPNDPKYLERWEEAQPQIDQQLKTLLGQQFFLRYEMATIAQKKP